MNKLQIFDKLKEIIANPNGNERRSGMRKLFGIVLGDYMKRPNWRGVGMVSPLIGTNSDQYDLRPSWSEYRDRCSLKTMAYMIDCGARLLDKHDYEALDLLTDDFVNAITEPGIHAVTKDATKTGIKRYEFGQNRMWTRVDEIWLELGGNIKRKRKPRRPASKPSTQQQPAKDDTVMPQNTANQWAISSQKKDRDLLDSVLKQVTNNEVSVERIESAVNGGLQAQAKVVSLEAEVRRLSTQAQHSAPVVMPAGLPELIEVEWRSAREVFEKNVKSLDFDVPVFNWKGFHPDVPTIDPNYVLRLEVLIPTLLSLVDNRKVWMTGHTGTGKSTLVKQIAAHLGWPVITLSLDGEITRMDLIGRDSLTTDENGQTISKFIDGVLPRAFSQPCILLCDEIDFIRDDIAYTLQTALNEGEVTITEDGGRVVKAGSWSRIIATANTLGQGDDSGLYRGAKVQSQAFLDRFTTWIDVEYMSSDEERKLLTEAYDDLPPAVIDQIMQYVHEHREGFINGTVIQPLSPRGLLALADRFVRYRALLSSQDQALKQAISEVLLNRSNNEDRIVLKGIINRVFSV